MQRSRCFFELATSKLAGEMAKKTGSYSPAGAQEQPQFYITRKSQETDAPQHRKLSYVGMRDLTEVGKIQEEDIIGPKGTIRGVKNRVRAGLANFENPTAIQKKSQEGGKIVVYTTTFRGVRSTFEECKFVLSVFHNFRVRVEERDIYIHKYYYRELEERLKKSRVKVPQIFISGQHIGGAQDLEELNESGELRKLLLSFPRYETANNCEACGGYEFVPCRKCGGSKNSVANEFTAEFRALKCTHCNENGLEPCPVCADRDREKKIEAKKKEEEEEEAKKEKEKKEEKEERVEVKGKEEEKKRAVAAIRRELEEESAEIMAAGEDGNEREKYDTNQETVQFEEEEEDDEKEGTYTLTREEEEEEEEEEVQVTAIDNGEESFEVEGETPMVDLGVGGEEEEVGDEGIEDLHVRERTEGKEATEGQTLNGEEDIIEGGEPDDKDPSGPYALTDTRI